jgi:hypothetical protein
LEPLDADAAGIGVSGGIRGKTAVAGAVSIDIVRPDRRFPAIRLYILERGISMASAPQTYKRGSQDIRENKATFALFWTLTKTAIILIAILMVVLAYSFT